MKIKNCIAVFANSQSSERIGKRFCGMGKCWSGFLTLSASVIVPDMINFLFYCCSKPGFFSPSALRNMRVSRTFFSHPMQLWPKFCGRSFVQKPKLNTRSQKELEKEGVRPKVGVILLELQNQHGLAWEGP